MIHRISARLVLLVAVVSTIGCDRVTKHIATTALAGVSARSYLGGYGPLGVMSRTQVGSSGWALTGPTQSVRRYLQLAPVSSCW